MCKTIEDYAEERILEESAYLWYCFSYGLLCRGCLPCLGIDANGT